MGNMGHVLSLTGTHFLSSGRKGGEEKETGQEAAPGSKRDTPVIDDMTPPVRMLTGHWLWVPGLLPVGVQLYESALDW